MASARMRGSGWRASPRSRASARRLDQRERPASRRLGGASFRGGHRQEFFDRRRIAERGEGFDGGDPHTLVLGVQQRKDGGQGSLVASLPQRPDQGSLLVVGGFPKAGDERLGEFGRFGSGGEFEGRGAHPGLVAAEGREQDGHAPFRRDLGGGCQRGDALGRRGGGVPQLLADVPGQGRIVLRERMRTSEQGIADEWPRPRGRDHCQEGIGCLGCGDLAQGLGRGGNHGRVATAEQVGDGSHGLGVAADAQRIDRADEQSAFRLLEESPQRRERFLPRDGFEHPPRHFGALGIVEKFGDRGHVAAGRQERELTRDEAAGWHGGGGVGEEHHEFVGKGLALGAARPRHEEFQGAKRGAGLAVVVGLEFGEKALAVRLARDGQGARENETQKRTGSHGCLLLRWSRGCAWAAAGSGWRPRRRSARSSSPR